MSIRKKVHRKIVKKKRLVKSTKKNTGQIPVIDFEKIEMVGKEYGVVYILTRYYGSPAIKCTVQNPPIELVEDDATFHTLIEAQIKGVGIDVVSEIYVEQTGTEWYIFLKIVPFEAINLDANHFLQATIEANGKY